jgi:hypothetical protein
MSSLADSDLDEVAHLWRIDPRTPPRLGGEFMRLSGLFQIVGRDASARAELNMEVHFIEDGGDRRGRFAHLRECPGLVSRERIGTGELNEKQIILHEIVVETCLGQRASAQLLDEIMLDVGPPILGTGRF